MAAIPEANKSERELFQQLITAIEAKRGAYQLGLLMTDGEEKVAAKKEAWEEMVLSKKIGFLGLLRNLRNILMSTGNPEVIQEWVSSL